MKKRDFESIKQIIENESPFDVSCYLMIDHLVLITKGTLAGIEGILIEERGSHRFVLIIE